MKNKIEKYISTDLIKYLLLPTIALLWFSITNLYSHSKKITTIYKDAIIEIDSINKNMLSILSLEELSTELLKKSGLRNIAELNVFFILSKRPNIHIDKIKRIPKITSRLKFEIAGDVGELNKYSTLNIDFANQNTFKTLSSLLDLELKFIDRLNEYHQFKVSSNLESDEAIYRQTESACFELYSKLHEIGARLSPDNLQQFKAMVAKQTQDDRDKVSSSVKEETFLINLSIFGVFFSSLMLVSMIFVSIRLKLFGKKTQKG